MVKNLFQGSWQKVLIRVIVLLLVLYVIYRIFRGVIGFAFKPKTSKEYKDFINNELPNVQVNDNSTPTDPETITDNEAKLIADRLQFAMDGFGTDEVAMFNAFQCLNGASLKKVYAEFGQRDYDGTMLDLFGWFSAELTNSLFVSGVYWDDCVPECNKYLDSCYELTYMQQIWKRTGMTLTF